MLEIPNYTSVVFLITSPYFDENVNDERNEFRITDVCDLLDELSWDIINPRIQQEIDTIILEKFPEIEDNNKKVILDLKKEFPYLTSYIDNDPSKIKNKIQIINNAKKAFEKEKRDISNRFKELLNKNKINSKDFDNIISDISDIASRELAEYIAYRQQIIIALEYMNNKNEKTESKIHNIFMRMRTESRRETSEVYDNNLWLFDDKFMTYIYAASDIQIKKYSKALNEIAKYTNTEYRPDLAVFFSNKDNYNKDAIVVELKSCGASLEEKSKSFWEINRNAQAIRDAIENIDRIWCYTVTKFDEKFRRNIRTQDFRPLFTNGENKELYYRYFSEIDAHCFYISLEALLADAKARNEVFLDIIQKNKKIF